MSMNDLLLVEDSTNTPDPLVLVESLINKIIKQNELKKIVEMFIFVYNNLEKFSNYKLLCFKKFFK